MTPSPRYGFIMTLGPTCNELFMLGGINEDVEFCDLDVFMLYESTSMNDKNWKIVEDFDLTKEVKKSLEKAEVEIDEQK